MGISAVIEISVCCRSRSVSGWWDESTRRCARPATNVCETRHSAGSITTRKPSVTYAIYCRPILQPHLRVVWYCPVSTTAIRYCVAVSRHYDQSVCRTMQPGSYCRLRGDRMHVRYCVRVWNVVDKLPMWGITSTKWIWNEDWIWNVNCTGCQFITESTTSWLWWLTRTTDLQHRLISVDTSSCASLHVSYAHRTFHCLTDLRSEQNLQSVLSDISYRLSGIRYLHQTVNSYQMHLVWWITIFITV